VISLLPDCYPNNFSFSLAAEAPCPKVCSDVIFGRSETPTVSSKTASHGRKRREETKFDQIELRENTFAVARWNHDQFEVPDVIAFADYATSSATVANDLQEHPAAADQIGSLLLFPYPKSSDSLRWLSIAPPDELIVLRAAAGRIVRLTDRLLSRRVLSNRLDDQYHCWRFRNQHNAWKRFTNFGVSLLDGRRYRAMCRTDVQSYYPSIDFDRLQSVLREWQCLTPAAFVVFSVLRKWHLLDGLSGLPLGPEISAVMGNFFLHPVDRSLEANGFEYLRWSDDILIFGRTMASCQETMLLLDDMLSNLRLARSIPKTLPFANVYDARRNLCDPSLASLTDVLKFDDEIGMEAVRFAYDSQIRGHPEVERYRFRWILKTLRNKRDPYACASLARDPPLMNVDPQLSTRYLADVGLSDSRVAEAVMERLLGPVEDRFDALDLHLLNAMRRKSWGSAEAKEFKSVATDASRRWPVRSYGWAAYARTTQNYSELMEAARAETNPHVRRSIITNLKGRSRRSFRDHARANFPESRYTIQWIA